MDSEVKAQPVGSAVVNVPPPMIDRPSRTLAGELLRHLVAGQITNDEFEERFPRSSDLAIGEMFGSGWQLYSDNRTYRLVGRDRLEPSTRTVIARCVLFLQTELPYEWPSSFGLVPFLYFVSYLLTLGYTHRWRVRHFESHGDISVWPFIRQSDYEAALKDATILGRAV
jgi:hypothetical protein